MDSGFRQSTNTQCIRIHVNFLSKHSGSIYPSITHAHMHALEVRRHAHSHRGTAGGDTCISWLSLKPMICSLI